MIRNGRACIGVFCLALLLGGGTVVGLFTGTQTQAAEPDFIIVAGGPTGGLFNIVGAAAAEILRKEFPKSIIDVVPGGSGPNLVQAEQKKITIGLTYANNSFDAWSGRDPAKPERPIRNVRGTIALASLRVFLQRQPDRATIQRVARRVEREGRPMVREGKSPPARTLARG